jgi:hypothetical protein
MFNFATHQKHILIQKNDTIIKTLFCLFLVLVCGSFVAQAQQKKTAQTIEIPASLKADTISKVTYTYKGKTYKQQAFIDLAYTKAAQKDKEYAAMISFLKAKKEINVVEKIESETWVFEADESMTEVANNLKETTKKAEDAKEGAKMAETMTQKIVGANLTQLSKDIENKVTGSEQKYVEYVDKYPELRKDTKVKVMYEKCKAKIKK